MSPTYGSSLLRSSNQETRKDDACYSLGLSTHHSGQARVTFGHQNIYLGVYDSPGSWAKYYELIQIYQANGFSCRVASARIRVTHQ